MRKITGLVLAAGTATRFGRNKLLEPLADGAPLGVIAIQALSKIGLPVVTVVRPGDERFSTLAGDAGSRIVECPSAAGGIGNSVACAVATTSDADGWIIALADMPFIELSTYRQVASVLANGADLVAPFYDGARGHPVGFSSGFRNELLALEGERGARDLIRRYGDRLTPVAVNDPGILRDVDRPEDLDTTITS